MSNAPPPSRAGGLRRDSGRPGVSGRLARLIPTLILCAVLPLSGCGQGSDTEPDEPPDAVPTRDLARGQALTEPALVLSLEQEAAFRAIDRRRLMAEVARLRALPSPGPDTRAPFARLDRDRDGVLSLAEFAAGWTQPPAAVTPDEARIRRLARTFVYYDRDGSASLSESEFTAALEGAMGATNAAAGR